MASVDILNPLAGDHILATNVRALVAYDLVSMYKPDRTFVALWCEFVGPTTAKTSTNVDTARPGSVEFSFGTLTAGTYKVHAYVLVAARTDPEDFEDPVEVGIAVVDPQITIDPQPLPPIPPVIEVTGTSAHLGPGNDIDVQVYGLNPGASAAEAAADKTARVSKKPFDKKFTSRSGMVRVTAFKANGDWSVKVPVEKHDHHLMIRAKMGGSKKQQFSRGRLK